MPSVQYTGTHQVTPIDSNGNQLGSVGNPEQVQIIGTVAVDVVSAASGGATPYHYIAAASGNQDSQNVKNTAGTIYAIEAFCTQATLRYLKIYDKATAPVSTDVPVKTLLVPGNASGAGFVLALTVGIIFANGIGFRLTTGLADNDANAVTANDLVVNIDYK